MRTVKLLCYKNDAIINGIKTIRELSGLGLKEAKKVSDDIRSGFNPVIEIDPRHSDFDATHILTASNLQFAELTITPDWQKEDNPAHHLQQAVLGFVSAGEFGIASSLLNILKRL